MKPIFSRKLAAGRTVSLKGWGWSFFAKAWGLKRSEVCQVHGAPSRSGNRMLLAMVLASLLLIVWHVWTFGPSIKSAEADALSRSFPALVAGEIVDLIFNKKGILAELGEVFPYFISGVLIAGFLRTYKIAVRLQASLRKYGVVSVFLASFVGIISPLCACGTLTTAISLLFAGLPLAPVMSLMVTSPLLSPSTYLITLNDLGPEWTVIRTVSAYAMGIFAGLVTHVLARRGFDTKNIFVEGGIVRGDFHDEDYPDERLRCGCRRQFGNMVAVRTGNNFLVFLAKSSEMLWTVGKYILVGVAIGAVIERYMPSEWIFRFFGEKGPLSIVWVTLASVPLFLHQVSASSIIHHIKGSLAGTLDNGAALAFMIGGPVTAVPTMVLFWTFFKKRVFFLYMSICLAGTMIIAYAFQLLVFVQGVDTGNPVLKGVGTLSGGISSVISKSDNNVRVVMDPGGRGLIATYADELNGEGGIVFDAGPGRLSGALTGRNDDLKYLANVAQWLEQNGNSPVSNTILIHHVGGDQGGDLSPASGRDLDVLGKYGFTGRRTGLGEREQLSDAALEACSQLWLIFGEGGARPDLTAAEIELISRHVTKGRSLFIVTGRQTSPGGEHSVNRLASRFGVTFSGAVDHGGDLPVSFGSGLLERGSETLGALLKVVRKS